MNMYKGATDMACGQLAALQIYPHSTIELPRLVENMWSNQIIKYKRVYFCNFLIFYSFFVVFLKTVKTT